MESTTNIDGKIVPFIFTLGLCSYVVVCGRKVDNIFFSLQNLLIRDDLVLNHSF